METFKRFLFLRYCNALARKMRRVPPPARKIIQEEERGNVNFSRRGQSREPTFNSLMAAK